MRKTVGQISWVVYRMTIQGKPSAMHAVCEQREWEEMERLQPGYHTLLMQGITNEGEAEKLARKSGLSEEALSGKPKHPVRKPRIWTPLGSMGNIGLPAAAAVKPPEAV